MPGFFDYFRQIVAPKPSQTVPPPQQQVRRAPAPVTAAQPTPIQPSVAQQQSGQSATIAARYGGRYAGYEELITTRPGGGYDLRAADAAIAADLRKQEISSLSGYGLTRYQFQQAGEQKRQAATQIQAAHGNVLLQQSLLPRYQAATEREWSLGIELERGWSRGGIPPTGPTPSKVSGGGVLQMRGEGPSFKMPEMAPMTLIPKGEFKQPSMTNIGEGSTLRPSDIDLFATQRLGFLAPAVTTISDVFLGGRTMISPSGKVTPVPSGWERANIAISKKLSLPPVPKSFTKMVEINVLLERKLLPVPLSTIAEAMVRYPVELYTGIREKPVSMAGWAGVGLLSAGVGDVLAPAAPGLATQFPRLATTISIQEKVLTALYAGYSGYRIATAQSPGREAAKIAATEVTPLLVGAASYRPLKAGVTVVGTKAYTEGMWFKEYTLPKASESIQFRARIMGESIKGRIEPLLGTGERLTIGPERPVIGLEEMSVARNINERVVFRHPASSPVTGTPGGTISSGTRGGQVLLSNVVESQMPITAAVSGERMQSLATYNLGSFAPSQRPVRLIFDEEVAYSVFSVASPFISQAPQQFSITGVKQAKNLLSSISSVAGQRQTQMQMQLDTTKIALGQIPAVASKSEMALANLLTPALAQKPTQLITPRIATIQRTNITTIPRTTTIQRTDLTTIPKIVEIQKGSTIIPRFARTFDPFGHGGGGRRRPLGAFGYRKWQSVLMPSMVPSFRVKGLDLAFGGKPRKGAKKPKRIRI